MNANFDITGIRLETKRLILREWQLSDLDDFYEYASVPGVGEMAGWHYHEDKDKSLAILNRFIEGKRTFALVYKENNKVIGSLGVEKYGLEDKLTEFLDYQGRSIGYVLSKHYWGRGLMVEAVSAVIDYLFNILNYDFLLCGNFDRNNQSRRVKEKLGFIPYRKLVFDTKINTKEPGVLGLLVNPNKKIKFAFSHPETLLINEENIKNNEKLLNFWNESIKLTEEDKKELIDEKDLNYEDLAPSQKLLNAVKELNRCEKVLDYGCGNGWASIVVSKNGAEDVLAVDIGENIIESARFYAKLFDAKIDAKSITPNWLYKVESNSFDGIICSNVLDVVPLETSKEIIAQLARVSKKNAKLVIGLNFYMSKETASKRGVELKDNRYLFVDDILRLTSLSDEEWKELFKPYFDIEKLDYFAWPNEPKETRRLFLLRKK